MEAALALSFRHPSFWQFTNRIELSQCLLANIFVLPYMSTTNRKVFSSRSATMAYVHVLPSDRSMNANLCIRRASMASSAAARSG